MPSPISTVEDYLQHVRTEENNLPSVMSAIVGVDVNSPKASHFETVTCRNAGTFSGTYLNTRWNQMIISRFMEFRRLVNVKRAQFISLKTQPKSPTMWLEMDESYCFGDAQAEGKIQFDGHFPCFQNLLMMDEISIKVLFDTHLSWIVEDKRQLSYSRMLWFYAVLSFIDKPLDPSTASNIRILYKVSVEAADNFNSAQIDSSHLSLGARMLSVLTGLYFHQSDRS